MNLNKKTNIKQILLKDITSCNLIEYKLNENENDFLDKVAKLIKSDVKMVQFSGYNLTSKKFIELARKIQQICSIYNVIFLIQNRCDIAKIINSDGVVLNCDDINLKYAIEIIGENKLFGYQILPSENGYVSEVNLFDFIIYNSNTQQQLNKLIEGSNLKNVKLIG